MKKLITKKEYTMIVGLMFLARQAYKKIADCERAYGEIVNMKEDIGSFGPFSDEIFSDGDVDIVLEKEGIKIKSK